MLRYTGHPLVDVGVATITAFAEKEYPQDLTEIDLANMADYITREYTRQPLKAFLTVAFPNSGFTQPAFEKTPQRRLDYAEQVLRSYRAEIPTLDVQCVFTGQPAVAIAFGDKKGLPLGRAFRQHIPLLTGENVINFSPYGDAGLPVSGGALLAIQAFPLGTAKCGGRLLAVHSNNQILMLRFAEIFLRQNQRAIQLAQQAGSKKMPESQYSYRTLLIDTLLEASQEQRESIDSDETPTSVTAYHLSNSGQGADLNMYHLPLEMMGFLRVMQRAENYQSWQAIVRRAWEVEPKKKKRKKDAAPFKPRRNWLYEDLFDLPRNAARFIRTYFLRIALQRAKNVDTDPRDGYSIQTEAELVSWKITAIFLRRIMHMDKERINLIRQIGDTLAEYVDQQNDRRFFRDFYTLQRYDYLRTALIKASLAYAKLGKAPILNFDTYVGVFEDGEDLARPDWRLARDLVLIRMIEQLYNLGWLGKNSDVISETDETNETDSSQA